MLLDAELAQLLLVASSGLLVDLVYFGAVLLVRARRSGDGLLGGSPKVKLDVFRINLLFGINLLLHYSLSVDIVLFAYACLVWFEPLVICLLRFFQLFFLRLLTFLFSLLDVGRMRRAKFVVAVLRLLLFSLLRHCGVDRFENSNLNYSH